MFPFHHPTSPMSRHAPFDAVTMTDKQQRMIAHLEQHRADLCGADMLAAAATRYVSEIYPTGDPFATDCTRTAVAVFMFFTGQMDLLRKCEMTPLLGAPCPTSLPTPHVLYLSLVGRYDGRFDTGSGHRLVIVLAKGRARVMHAFKDRFTLNEHMRRTGSMSYEDFEVWWAKLQVALACTDGSERAKVFADLLGPVDFQEAVGKSWLCSAAVALE